jgi:dihydrofolate reductase
MQAPGGPEEDPSKGFRYGGWIANQWDEAAESAIGETLTEPFALLLGKRTYDIFSAYWPFAERDPSAPHYDAGNAHISKLFDRITKYVATHETGPLTWQNSKSLGADVVKSLHALKKEDGPPLVTQGSSDLVQLLLQNGLVDELRVFTFPLLLGKGKRLFEGSTATAANAFKLTKSAVGSKGSVIAYYEKAGAVETGTIGSEEPSDLELERRKKLR